jgi:hypothetical protein
LYFEDSQPRSASGTRSATASLRQQAIRGAGARFARGEIGMLLLNFCGCGFERALLEIEMRERGVLLRTALVEPAAQVFVVFVAHGCFFGAKPARNLWATAGYSQISSKVALPEAVPM